MTDLTKNNEAALIACLAACVEIMERVHPNGLPVSLGTLCEEQDWAMAIFMAKRELPPRAESRKKVK